jgi:hypothetical protein
MLIRELSKTKVLVKPLLARFSKTGFKNPLGGKGPGELNSRKTPSA